MTSATRTEPNIWSHYPLVSRGSGSFRKLAQAKATVPEMRELPLTGGRVTAGVVPSSRERLQDLGYAVFLWLEPPHRGAAACRAGTHSAGVGSLS
jgi:hypothetical protein